MPKKDAYIIFEMKNILNVKWRIRRMEKLPEKI